MLAVENMNRFPYPSMETYAPMHYAGYMPAIVRLPVLYLTVALTDALIPRPPSPSPLPGAAPRPRPAASASPSPSTPTPKTPSRRARASALGTFTVYVVVVIIVTHYCHTRPDYQTARAKRAEKKAKAYNECVHDLWRADCG